MSTNMDTGLKGEQAAADYLSDNGFTILHRNWRNGRYELDIVASKGDTVHFVEVKCRKRNALTSPSDAITDAKFRSLMKAANAYIETYGTHLEPQFDLIAVEYDEYGFRTEYVPNAMIPRW